MSNYAELIEGIGETRDLEDLVKALNKELESRNIVENNELLSFATALFSSGEYFTRTLSKGNNFECTYVRKPNVVLNGDLIEVRFEEGYKVGYNEELNSTTLHNTCVRFTINDESDLALWSKNDEYIFVGSKTLLDDVSKKIKKWLENKTL